MLPDETPSFAWSVPSLTRTKSAGEGGRRSHLKDIQTECSSARLLQRASRIALFEALGVQAWADSRARGVLHRNYGVVVRLSVGAGGTHAEAGNIRSRSRVVIEAPAGGTVTS